MTVGSYRTGHHWPSNPGYQVTINGSKIESSASSLKIDENKKDRWDKADVIGKLIGSVLIPLGIAAATISVNLGLQDRAEKQKTYEIDRSAKQKTTEIAISVLQSKDADIPELKSWARGVFNEVLATADHALPPGAQKELDSQPLPSSSTQVHADFVNRRFSPTEFREYVSNLKFKSWKPTFFVVGSSGTKFSDWHKGDPQAKIDGLTSGIFQSWGGGPHLVIDDQGIWVVNSLTRRGVYSPSWNAQAMSIMLIGNYEEEILGQAVEKNLAEAIAALGASLDIAVSNIKFKSEDPRSHHLSPGKNVAKAQIINDAKLLQAAQQPHSSN